MAGTHYQDWALSNPDHSCYLQGDLTMLLQKTKKKKVENRNAIITTMLEPFQSPLHYLLTNTCSIWEIQPVLPSTLHKTALATKHQSACSCLLSGKVQNWQGLTSCQACRWLNNTMQFTKDKLPRKSTCFWSSSMFTKQWKYLKNL